MDFAKHICVLENIFPLTEEELSMTEFIYRTENPGRNLVVHARIPFIDESKSWYYEVNFAMQIYTAFTFQPPVLVSCVLLLTIVTQLQVQYVILSRHIEMFGKHYGDSNNNLIMCMNMEENQYSVLSKNDRSRLYNEHGVKTFYEHHHFRQVVVFHQKLIHFESKVSHHYFR